jgi:L-asparaginase II
MTEDPLETMRVLVEVTRGAMVESRHRGAYAVLDAKGAVVRSCGPIDLPVYPRSAIKPLQALPLVETGTADSYGVTTEELALACASHGGEAMHVQKVKAWMDRIGFQASDLECGPHAPLDQSAATTLIRRNETPSRLHNNCSGKHLGFLSTARCQREPTRGYIGEDHPVQVRAIRAVSEMTGLDLARAPRGTDGCGIPVIALTLRGMALAMARMADPTGLHDDRRAAVTRILAAMAAAPELVDGSVGMTRAVIAETAGAVLLKPGAEGVYAAALPRLGWGVALKIEDGAPRAAQAAMIGLLDRLGLLEEAQRLRLQDFLHPKLHNTIGVEVGAIRAV